MGALDGAITGVTISNSSKIVTVTFAVNDAAGLPVTGLTNFEFTIAKLVPATSDKPTQWQSYINRSILATGGARVLRAAGERAAATEVSTGVYRYTFCTDIEAAATFQYYGSGTEPAGSCSTAAVGRSGVLNSAAAGPILAGLNLVYAPNAVHRIAIASRNGSNSAGTLAQYNAVLDFVPASLPNFQAAKANQVVTDESCGACHALNSSDRGRLSFPFHGNTRYDVALCTTCHNPSTFDSRGSTDTNWSAIDLGTMAHKLHSAVPYSLDGVDYSSVAFPSGNSVLNCRSCHDNQRVAPPANRPEADQMAWMTNISQQACNTCHAVDYTNHFGNQPGNSQCADCHGPTRSLPVNVAHADVFSTLNNPEIASLKANAGRPIGVLKYEIDSVTVDADRRPIVKFRVLLDGQPLGLANLPAGIRFGGTTSPGFKIAWSKADGLVTSPADFNNAGGTGRNFYGFGDNPYAQYVGFSKVDQPFTVGMRDMMDTIGAPDADGWYTSVPGIGDGSGSNSTPVVFPEGAVLRAVAIESYFNFFDPAAVVADSGVNIAGDAPLKFVAGDGPRRGTAASPKPIVAMETCNTCHERLGFHSNSGRKGNVEHCAMCHNPELSSSNTFKGFVTATNGLYSLTPLAGYTEVDQKSNNIKDMVHSIHAGGVRATPFNFVRGTLAGGSGQGLHAYEDVVYSARISDCGSCHNPGTYAVGENPRALPSVIAVAPGISVTRITPTSAACGTCHDGSTAQGHIAQNSAGGVETCVLCHAPGKSAEAHKN